MIRVLQVGTSANPGGIESCLIRYFRHIDRSNFIFDFADIYGEGLAHSDEIRALGGNIYTFHNYKKHPFQMISDMSKLLKNQKYDIVHIHMLSAANLLPVSVACRSGKKVIVHSHNSSVPPGALRKVLNMANRFPLRHMSVKKWACSKMAGVWMWGNDFDEANILPNAIETEMFQYNKEKRNQIRGLCGYGEEDIVIGFVGRLCEQKNVLFLPEIMDELVKKSRNYKMLIVGDGNLKQPLLQKIQTMGLGDYIFMAGVHQNVSPWYQAMDAFLLPSLFEGLPVVGVEAQAAGLPCFFSENISKECALTKRCAFLSLNPGSSVWASAIQRGIQTKRDECERLPQNYQIKYASKMLEERYVRLLRETK